MQFYLSYSSYELACCPWTPRLQTSDQVFPPVSDIGQESVGGFQRELGRCARRDVPGEPVGAVAGKIHFYSRHSNLLVPGRTESDEALGNYFGFRFTLQMMVQPG